jgi:hypothetical protein
MSTVATFESSARNTSNIPNDLMTAIDNLVNANQYQLQASFLSSKPEELEIVALVPPYIKNQFLEEPLNYLRQAILKKIYTIPLPNNNTNANIRLVPANIEMEKGWIYINQLLKKQTMPLKSAEFHKCFMNYHSN